MKRKRSSDNASVSESTVSSETNLDIEKLLKKKRKKNGNSVCYHHKKKVFFLNLETGQES